MHTLEILSFEWHVAKAKSNLRKHGVDFADAVTVLEDESALTLRDAFSAEEERWITLGTDAIGRLLAWCIRGGEIRSGLSPHVRPRDKKGGNMRHNHGA